MCFGLFLVSVAIRFYIFHPSSQIIENYDSPWQTLLILRAWAQTPASVHHFLPLVSLGGLMDKGIEFGIGSTLPHDAAGNYYYLSFPPLGFFVPYVIHFIFRIEPTFISLMVYNLGIHFICALIIVVLSGRACQMFSATQRTTIIVQILAAATYLFSYEPMFTHGPIYWCQSLTQIPLLTACYAITRLIENPKDILFSVVIVLLCFITPYIEWTGFVAAAGFTIAFFYLAWHEKNSLFLLLAFSCGAAAAFSLIVYLLHIMTVIGFSESVQYLLFRWSIRTANGVPFQQYLWGIIQSFAALPIVALFAIIATYRKLQYKFIVLCFVAGFPALENIAVLSHATFYFFDRTKIVTILILVLSAWTILSQHRRIVVFMWCLAIVTNVALIFIVPKTIEAASVIDNTEHIWNSLSTFNKPCAIVTASSNVRGWYMTLANRGIYELIGSIEAMEKIVRDRGACLGIWITSSVAPTGWWDTAYVYDPTQDRIIFTIKP